MTSNSRPSAFGIGPGFSDAPLPLTVAAVESFFADIISRLAAIRHGLLAAELTLTDLVAYGERRMPAVFSRESITRGTAMATLSGVMERVEEAPAPEGGMTWPPNPQWLADLVNEFVPELIMVWAYVNVYIPGTAELRRDLEQTLPKVMVPASENGRHQARTGLLRIDDTEDRAQYTIWSENGTLHFGRRIRGRSGLSAFERFVEIPVEARDAVLALLRWHHGTVRNQSGSRHR